jgi:hypothetical protein
MRAAGVGFEPTARFQPSSGFQDRPVRPLRHPAEPPCYAAPRPPSRRAHHSAKIVSLSLVVGVVALVVAVVGVVAAIGCLGLYEAGVIGANGSANLGVASILCSLIAIPIGLVGWRWAERRGQEPTWGKSATLVAVGMFAAWFVLFVYALGRDTP